MSVLGAIFIDNAAFGRAYEILQVEDFYREPHREIFAAMFKLATARQPIDAITITEELRSKHTLEHVGGPAYIAELAAIVPTASNAEHYAEIVHRKARARGLAMVSTQIASDAYDGAADEPAFFEGAGARFFDACFERNDRRAMMPISRILPDVLDGIFQRRGGGISGISSGLADLDQSLSGFEPGQLIIIAARPGMGKTSLATQLALQISRALSVGFFSLEMTKEELATRMLCQLGEVPYSSVRDGRLGVADVERLLQAQQALSEHMLDIDDSSTTGPLQLRNRCLNLMQRNNGAGLGAIFVDYLQLMAPDRRGERRETEIATITRAMKALAKEFKCPVFLLSQLNRQVESRPDKRPVLADLRESGAIEQDADVVMFLYRDDYYHGKDSKTPNVAEVLIAKQRNGPTGVERLTWQPRWMGFKDYAEPERYAELNEAAAPPLS